MNILHRKNTGRWFTLTVNSRNGFPCVIIKNEYINNAQRIPDDILRIHCVSLEEGLGALFPVAGGNLGGAYFGFGTCIERTRVTKNETKYQVNLPRIRIPNVYECPSCYGKKKIKHFGFQEPCLRCSGSGKIDSYEWGSAYMTSLSLSLLMNVLWSAEPFPYDKRKQHQILDCTLITLKKLHGGSLGGSFSPYTVETLKSFDENFEFSTIARAMKRAHRHMWGNAKYVSDRFFHAWQEIPANLILQIPGNACEIHPSPHVREIPKGEGLEYTCHNVDSPLQQLTLFTGLAALCDVVK